MFKKKISQDLGKTKPRGRWKEIITIRAEMNEIEANKQKMQRKR